MVDSDKPTKQQRRRVVARALAFAVAGLASATAVARPAPGATPVAAGSVGAPGATATPSAGAPSATATPGTAAPATGAPGAGPAPAALVDELLLAPVAAARVSIDSWAQAQAMLLAGSSDLRRAEAALARAEAVARQALAATLPTVRLSLTGAFDLDNPDVAPGVAPRIDDRTPTTPVAIAALSASQRLVDLSSWRSRDAADLARAAARSSVADVHRRLRQRLARTLVASVAAERIAELGRVGLGQALERAALSQRTFELGRATELDVVRARQDVTAARASLIVADEQLRVARESLGIALSYDEPIGVGAKLSLDGLFGELGASCRALVVGELRADERAAAQAVESLDVRTRAAKAATWPTLEVSTTLGAVTTDPGPARVSTWSIVALLSVPIWDSGGRAAVVRERAAAADEARAGVDELRRGVRVEVARARRGVEVTAALLREASDGRALAERLDQMTRRSFEMGRSTSLELVQSAALLRQAELTLALRQLEWMQARVDAMLIEADCERQGARS